jgi:hypothetical protein
MKNITNKYNGEEDRPQGNNNQELPHSGMRMKN